MTHYVFVFAAALLVALLVTPAMGKLAQRFGIVDRPNARKVHQTTTPLLGGLAIFSGVAIGVFIVMGALWFGVEAVRQAFERPEWVTSQAVAVAIGSIAMVLLGIVDDGRALSWQVKLIAQIGAALVVVAPGVDLHVQIFPWDLVNRAATVLWIVTVTNAINFLDNMDGLSGGIVAVATGFFFVMAATNGQVIIATVSIALFGACLGFLRFNFNRATIFMGDSGTSFLGYVVAIIGIKLKFLTNDYHVTWMTPVLALGLPLFDIGLVVVLRLRRGLSPATPGKDHTSHRLVALGLSRREAVLTLYVVCGLLGLTALFVSVLSVAAGYMVAGIVAVAGLYAFYRLAQADPLVYPKA